MARLKKNDNLIEIKKETEKELEENQEEMGEVNDNNNENEDKNKSEVSLVLKPIANLNGIIHYFNEHQKLMNKILQPEDVVMINNQRYLKRSALRKMALIYNISTEIISENRRDLPNYFVWEITAKAISPSGRFTTATASCASNEKRFTHTEHDVRAVSTTRAINRALYEILGMPGCSYEEISDNFEDKSRQREEIPIFNQSSKEIKPLNLNESVSFGNNNKILDKINSAGLITGIQYNYLSDLIRKKYTNPTVQQEYILRIGKFSKKQASDLIFQLTGK